jgi:hypothetical protein
MRGVLAAICLAALSCSAWAEEGRISRLVRAAKARNESSIVLAAPIGVPTGIGTLDQVFGDYSILIAHPVKKTVVVDRDNITTWYEFVAEDTVTRQPRIGLETWSTIPVEFMSPRRNTVLVPELGGQADVDSVTVNEPSLFSFELGQRYLLIVYLEHEGRVGSLAADQGSAFMIDKSSHLLTKYTAHPIAQELQSFHRSSLDSLMMDGRRRTAVR